jgi:hypothetical protein
LYDLESHQHPLGERLRWTLTPRSVAACLQKRKFAIPVTSGSRTIDVTLAIPTDVDAITNLHQSLVGPDAPTTVVVDLGASAGDGHITLIGYDTVTSVVASAGDGHITLIGYDTVTSVVDDLVAGTRDGDALDTTNTLSLIVAGLDILQKEITPGSDARATVVCHFEVGGNRDLVRGYNAPLSAFLLTLIRAPS